MEKPCFEFNLKLTQSVFPYILMFYLKKKKKKKQVKSERVTSKLHRGSRNALQRGAIFIVRPEFDRSRKLPGPFDALHAIIFATRRR